MPYARCAISQFELANKIYADASVSFYTVDDAGTKTSDLAKLYANVTGTSELQNPQTLDSYGKFTVPVYIEEPVIAVITASDESETEQETGIISNYGRNRGAYVTSTLYYSNDLVQDSSTGIVYAVTNSYTSVSLVQDIADGNLEVFLTPSSLSGDYLPKTRETASKTSDYTATVGDSGTLFDNALATAPVYIFLPGATVGVQYSFYVAAGQKFAIQAGSGDLIKNGSEETSVAGEVYSSTIGDMISVVAVDSTTWSVELISGTWTTT